VRSSRRMRSAVILLLTVALVVHPRGVGAQEAPLFWETLGDPTLERLVARALNENLDLRAAEARVRGARAARMEAGFDLAPRVTAHSGYTRQRLSGVATGAGVPVPGHDLWDAGVRMSWELDVFGSGRRTLRGRNALLASAEEDVLDVEVLLAAEVAEAYFDLRGAQDRLAVAERNARNQRGTLEVTLQRLDAGRGTALDTERAQAQLSSTLAVIPSLEAAIEAARHRIGALLAYSPGTIGRELGDGGAPLTLPAAGSPPSAEALIRQRPDLRSAERRAAAGSAFVAAAKSRYLPRVSIEGVAGYSADTFGSLGSSGTPRYAIGPVISWPLLDLGRVRSGVDAARAREAEAAAHLRQATFRAAEEVETSLSRYRKARERLQHLEDAAAASERATELARIRYEEGGTGFLEVLDAERTQLEAQDRLAAGRTDAVTGLVAVYRALGGKWPTGDGP
jgi:outer membrane protein, multidrug efflux system